MAAVQVPAPAGSATGQDNGTTRGSALSSQQDGSQQRQDASTSSSALQHLGRASGLETGSGSTPSPSLLATTSSTSLRQQDDVVDQPPAEPAPRQASTQSTYLGKTHVSSLEASLSSNAKGKQRAISQQPVRASSGDASGGSSTANLARLFEATELERLRVENQLLKRQSQVLAVKRGRLQVTRQVVGDQDGEDQRLDKQVKGLKSDNRLLSQRVRHTIDVSLDDSRLVWQLTRSSARSICTAQSGGFATATAGDGTSTPEIILAKQSIARYSEQRRIQSRQPSP